MLAMLRDQGFMIHHTCEYLSIFILFVHANLTIHSAWFACMSQTYWASRIKAGKITRKTFRDFEKVENEVGYQTNSTASVVLQWKALKGFKLYQFRDV